MEQAYKTPLEDLKNKALQDYDDAATKAHHWNSDIPKAIEFYYNHKASKDKQPRANKKVLGLFGVVPSFIDAISNSVEKLGKTVKDSGLIPTLAAFWCLIWGIIGAFVCLVLFFSN